MTNSPVQDVPASATPEIRLPNIAWFLYFVSPFLLLFGSLITMGVSNRPLDNNHFQSTLGTVTFLVGVLFLLTAITLSGVRAIAQQQVDLLLRPSAQQGIM